MSTSAMVPAIGSRLSDGTLVVPDGSAAALRRSAQDAGYLLALRDGTAPVSREGVWDSLRAEGEQGRGSHSYAIVTADLTSYRVSTATFLVPDSYDRKGNLIDPDVKAMAKLQSACRAFVKANRTGALALYYDGALLGAPCYFLPLLVKASIIGVSETQEAIAAKAAAEEAARVAEENAAKVEEQGDELAALREKLEAAEAARKLAEEVAAAEAEKAAELRAKVDAAVKPEEQTTVPEGATVGQSAGKNGKKVTATK